MTPSPPDLHSFTGLHGGAGCSLLASLFALQRVAAGETVLLVFPASSLSAVHQYLGEREGGQSSPPPPSGNLTPTRPKHE